MAVIVRELANKKTRREAGLDHVTSSMEVLTPFGARLIKSQRPFLPGQEDELRAEFARIGQMADIAGRRGEETGVLRETLSMMKDNSFTISRSGDSVLSVVEIFELKNLLLLMDRARALTQKTETPGEFVPEDVTELLDILDPGGDRLSTFYIYDSFSEKLTRLRKEKKDLERELRREQRSRKAEIREKYGLSLTPKFDITLSKSDEEGIEAVKAVPDLVRSDEDYTSITFSLAPAEGSLNIIRKMDNLTADIEEEELAVRERLSREIFGFSEMLLSNCDRIGRLDLTLAKALYARKHDCVAPEIAAEHVLEFEDGRHLQVEEIIEKRGGKYCPVSLSLEDGVTCITGANMGGKTVSLRLAGMVAVLTQYGYFVPCARARVGLSNFIRMLIGDSQSVERGLSSFGGEMEELREMMDNSLERSLLLIDEIASGTNPAEGLALTRSIVDHLKTRQYISLITTHYDKVGSSGGVVNMQVTGLAGVDFDRLYREIRYARRRERIEIIRKYMDYRLRRVDSAKEIPRDALNIARMLGIDDAIIENAKRYLT